MSNISIHGVDLSRGDRVVVCIDSANRDELRFSEPDSFDINRGSIGFAFGSGLHTCPAAILSRLTTEIFINYLIDNYNNYRIDYSGGEPSFLITKSGNNDLILNIQIRER